MDYKQMERRSLDTICDTLCYTMGIESPQHAAEKHPELTAYIDTALEGRKADRVFMYNPDAIAQWIYEKYPELFVSAEYHSGFKVPLRSVIPPKTPVCFATMYSGAQPEVHGIQKYEKPVLKIDTIFDALVRAGKKVAILASSTCSIGMIFLERKIDYFLMESIDAINAKAAELIMKDEHDFIVVYNGDYDYFMHDETPEGTRPLACLRSDSSMYAMFCEMIAANWKNHDTLVAFAMDHGCHYKQLSYGGTHGKDIPEDMEIVHFYKAFPKTK